jgi:hypothetical protein
MSDHDSRRDQPAASDLHPVVYGLLLGLVLWLVLAVWGFAGDGYADFLLPVVSAFILMFVGIPATLYLMTRRHPDPGQSDADQSRESFRDWVTGDFETWQDRVKGANAAVEVLLPMAAIAIGMTAFAIVHYLTAHGA